ncbi:MAG TPA: hypothetical protein DCZ03_13005 [Gammaproteobacteria bacterium]|nr:hypothetical protein [Gammaproteobacteria bacterium]
MAEISTHLDIKILLKVENELENLYAVVDAYQAMQAIQIKVTEVERTHPFWREILTSLTSLFVINWCKLFGIDSDDRFWKQATLEQKEFRELVYRNAGFDYQEWNQYRHAMHELKNELIIHLTPYHKIDHPVDLAQAFSVAESCHHWLHAVMKDVDISEGPVTQKDYVAESLAEAIASLESITPS